MSHHIVHNLEQVTTCDWEEVFESSLFYSLERTSDLIICAITPDVNLLTSPFRMSARLYTIDSLDQHFLSGFIDKTNQYHRLITSMPTTLLSVDNNFQAFKRTAFGKLSKGNGFCTITFEIKFTGKLVLQKPGSLQELEVSPERIIYERRVQVAHDFLSDVTQSIKFNSDGTITFDVSEAGKFSTTSYKLTPPNKVEVDYTPRDTNVHVPANKNAWGVYGELGFTLSGTYTKINTPGPPPIPEPVVIPSDDWQHSAKVVTGIGAVGAGIVLIFFVPEALLAASAAAAAYAFMPVR